MDPHRNYRPLLDLIGLSEGTDPPKGRGYNETLNYGAYTGGPVDLVSMTLDQVDALQTRMLAHPQNKLNSSACGRYQIVRTTLRTIRKHLALTGRELFDAAMQDRMACYLLGRRGIDLYLVGDMAEKAIVLALAQEWASLPTMSGRGHYDGQRAAVSVDQVRQALAEVRARHGRPAAAPVPAPPPPAEREPEPVSHSKRFWTWATTGLTGGGLVSGIAGLDPWLQRGLGLLLIGLAVYAIVSMPAVRARLGWAAS